MTPFDYKELLVRLLPHSVLIIGALIALFLDQSRGHSWAASTRALIANLVGVFSIIVAIALIHFQSKRGSFYNGMLQVSDFVHVVQTALLILSAATLLIAVPEKFTSHISEYVSLILLGTVGLLLLASTEELLTAFVALELTSLSLYLLAGFRKDSLLSAEAGLKYFLFGSVAAAFTLFGISLVFGLAGSTNFELIGRALSRQQLSPLLIVALVMTAIGLGFKLAAAPLHLWAPDAYQGAPAPSAALIASGSKLASFVLFLKFFFVAAPTQAGSAFWFEARPGWTLLIATFAALSLILGNLLALAQSNLRRLIAYSAIAHAGYILISLFARTDHGPASAVYYLFTYGLAVVGIFGIIGLVETRHGELTLSELRGLSRRSPLLAICLLVFVLSLAGIPPLAGFFGKFYVFLAALDASRSTGAPGMLWIIILAIAASAVSLYYYLIILKQAFVAEDSGHALLPGAPLQKGMVLFLAIAIVLLGCFPTIVINRLNLPPEPTSLELLDKDPRETSVNSSHLFTFLR